MYLIKSRRIRKYFADSKNAQALVWQQSFSLMASSRRSKSSHVFMWKSMNQILDGKQHTPYLNTQLPLGE